MAVLRGACARLHAAPPLGRSQLANELRVPGGADLLAHMLTRERFYHRIHRRAP
jgi:hypothetical protein